jgi:mRNA interferase MazF
LPPSANMVVIGKLSEQDSQGVRNCVKLSLVNLDE